ncbi:YjiH family protein [Senegalia massiliensis]|uniref:YjiH family protein n=1 Tax=Senegalia massiliensis TaxID=1720316 RepID=UPI00103143E3|nr:nucleoside recognition domain-containing protein [Senegalia massiliensis]
MSDSDIGKIEKSNVRTTDVVKFAIFSLIGALLFLFPIKYGNSFNIPVGIGIDFVKGYIHEYTKYIMLIFVVINAILTTINYFFKPNFIQENKWLNKVLVATPLYLVSRIIGAIVIVMVFFQLGPEAIISGSTGGTMLDLTMSLVSVLLVISYTMPLITDFGIMEFSGVLIRSLVKPLFTVPGRSAVDLMTSWFGASNAAVLLTERQYNTGYYSGREAAVIMTNFSLVSIPFCYIVATIIGIENLFTPFYLTIVVVGFILAAIIPRIPPLNRVTEDYNKETGKVINETVPQGKSKFAYAVETASLRAKDTTFSDVIKQGNDMFFSVIFGLAPIILSWGTISLILVEFTPVFNILAYPFGFYLDILGVEGAFELSPATLVGFADMFIPGLILAPSKIIETKFILGILSLVQIIYLTEVGVIIINSKVPIGFKELLFVFLERTVIAIPLIVLMTKLLL